MAELVKVPLTELYDATSDDDDERDPVTVVMDAPLKEVGAQLV